MQQDTRPTEDRVGSATDGAALAARLPPEERYARARRFVSGLPADAPWLSMVVPAFQEAGRILPTLLSVTLYLRELGRPFEVLVVDDGSRDDTVAVVERFAATHPEVRVVSLGRNRGKGAAVREGMRVARGAWLLMNDADGATPIGELDRLLVAAARGVPVVIGSRALAAPGVRIERHVARFVIGRIFARLVQWLAVPGIADSQCGFKLFRRDAAEAVFPRQRLERFGFDVEVLYLAHRLGFGIAEVAVNWNNVAGSKVGLLSGASGFLDVFRVRWLHRGSL
jgi:dolichyl-phosphate beta-glucosyltransferase